MIVAKPSKAVLLEAAILGAIYFVAGLAAIKLSDAAGGIVPLWPANAIVLATLLRRTPGAWLYYLLAGFLADWVLGLGVGDTVLFSAGFALCDSLDVVLAAVVLQRIFQLPANFDKIWQLLVLLLVAALLAPMAGSSLAASLQAIAYGDPYWQGWITWWISSAVGMVIVAPLWLELDRARLTEWRAEIVPGEVAAMALSTSALVVFVFQQNVFFLLFMLMPFLLWSALRAGRFGAAVHNVLIMAPAVWYTVNGMGPIVQLYPDSVANQVLFLQFFLATLAMPALVIATVFGEKTRARELLRKTVAQLRHAQAIAKLNHWEYDTTTDRLRVPSGQTGIVVSDAKDLEGLTDEAYVERFVHPEDRARVLDAYGLPGAKKSRTDIEYRIIRSDGEERIVHETGESTCDETGLVISQFGTIQDVTERRTAERALRDKDERLRSLQSQLIRATRISTVGGLSSAIVHELSQPLTAIMNYAMAGSRVIDRDGEQGIESLREIMAKSIEQTQRANSVIQSLRRLYQKGEMAFIDQDLNQAVEEACTIGLLDAKQLNIRVDLDLDRSLLPVKIDRIQVQQVVLNLLRNGIDAMSRSDQRRLSVKTSFVAGATAEVAVSDTGTGLSDEVRARLFQPFVTSSAEGMGMGLAICRSIIEAHGGKLWAETNSAGGATFRFTVQMVASKPSETETPLFADRAKQAASG